MSSNDKIALTYCFQPSHRLSYAHTHSHSFLLSSSPIPKIGGAVGLAAGSLLSSGLHNNYGGYGGYGYPGGYGYGGDIYPAYGVGGGGDVTIIENNNYGGFGGGGNDVTVIENNNYGGFGGGDDVTIIENNNYGGGGDVTVIENTDFGGGDFGGSDW